MLMLLSCLIGCHRSIALSKLNVTQALVQQSLCLKAIQMAADEVKIAFATVIIGAETR